MPVNIDLITEDLRNMIAKVVEKTPEMVTDNILFSNLGADSMMMLEIMVATERKYKIEIPEEHLSRMVNLKETVNIIKSLQR